MTIMCEMTDEEKTVDGADSFTRIYNSARQSWLNQEDPLSKFFSTQDLNTRRFGIEIEFNSDEELYFDESACTCHCTCVSSTVECHCFQNCVCMTDKKIRNKVSRWLHRKGYLPVNYASFYHVGQGEFDAWRYESDDSVTGGEVISPILDNNAASWVTISNIMKGIESQGGNADDENCGGHISIDVSDFTEAHVRRLITLGIKFEDVMYRLATNPYRAKSRRANGDNSLSHHRGIESAYPINTYKVADFYESGRSPLIYRDSWFRYTPSQNRLEFRIFDGTLNPALAQTWALIANAFTEMASRTDLDSVISTMPDRTVNWHYETQCEYMIQNSELEEFVWDGTDAPEEVLRELTDNIRQFVDFFFTKEEDKERVITLFAGNDWNECY